MTPASKTPWTYLTFLLLTLFTLTSSLPPPVQRQPTPLVLPTSSPQILAVNPTAIPIDPYLITINRFTNLYFQNYADPPLGSPSSLVFFIRKLREKLFAEASSHGGASGILTHLDFSRQQGGFVINFAVDWEPRQEGKKLMLTYAQLVTIVGGMDDWRIAWGRKTKVVGCEFTWERAAQEGSPVQVVARGRWGASPAGTGVLGTSGYGSGVNVTSAGGGGAEGRPAVVETSRKRSRDRLSDNLGVKPLTNVLLPCETRDP